MRIPSILVLALAFPMLTTACDKGDEPELPTDGLSSVKSDCPDCDPAGPNAFIQAGVATGFYHPGLRWRVAFRYDHTPLAEKRGTVFLGEDEASSEAFLFDYTVLATDKAIVNNVLRETATIEVSQATDLGPFGDLFSPERMDSYEYRVEFTMNDLLEPMTEKVYTRRYPNGKRVRLDSKSSLRTGASVFPRTIPRLMVSSSFDAPAPTLPSDLRDAVDLMDPSWSSTAYKKVIFENGDVVYWAQGREQYWPFYVKTRQGEGVLVSWDI